MSRLAPPLYCLGFDRRERMETARCFCCFNFLMAWNLMLQHCKCKDSLPNVFHIPIWIPFFFSVHVIKLDYYTDVLLFIFFVSQFLSIKDCVLGGKKIYRELLLLVLFSDVHVSRTQKNCHFTMNFFVIKKNKTKNQFVCSYH